MRLLPRPLVAPPACAAAARRTAVRGPRLPRVRFLRGTERARHGGCRDRRQPGRGARAPHVPARLVRRTARGVAAVARRISRGRASPGLDSGFLRRPAGAPLSLLPPPPRPARPDAPPTG